MYVRSTWIHVSMSLSSERAGYVGTNTCEIFNNIRGGIEILTSTRKIGTMKAFKAEFDLI